MTGIVAAINPAAEDSPEKITEDPYGEGWLIEIGPAGGEDPPLLAPADYDRIAAER